MSQKLCWKCRKNYGICVPFNSHCHHEEPEEKPKCWCELEGEKRLQVHDYTIDKWNLGYYQMRVVEIAQYCPYCGKRIKEAV